MRRSFYIEMGVGLFVLAALIAFIVLAFKVSGLTQLNGQHSYQVQAEFTNIGDLKVRAPVTIAGVRVGEVSSIELEPGTFVAKVTMRIDDTQNKIPLVDTSARILTQGLLGSNYVSIEPGFEEEEGKTAYLHSGSKIEKTQQAIILENLIGQLLFSINKN